MSSVVLVDRRIVAVVAEDLFPVDIVDVAVFLGVQFLDLLIQALFELRWELVEDRLESSDQLESWVHLACQQGKLLADKALAEPLPSAERLVVHTFVVAIGH